MDPHSMPNFPTSESQVKDFWITVRDWRVVRATLPFIVLEPNWEGIEASGNTGHYLLEASQVAHCGCVSQDCGSMWVILSKNHNYNGKQNFFFWGFLPMYDIGIFLYIFVLSILESSYEKLVYV